MNMKLEIKNKVTFFLDSQNHCQNCRRPLQKRTQKKRTKKKQLQLPSSIVYTTMCTRDVI